MKILPFQPYITKKTIGYKKIAEPEIRRKPKRMLASPFPFQYNREAMIIFT